MRITTTLLLLLLGSTLKLFSAPREAAASYAQDTASINQLIKQGGKAIIKYPDSGKLLIDSALKLAGEIDYRWGRLKALNTSGSYYWTTANFAKAKDIYQKVKELAFQYQDTGFIVTAFNNLGLVANRSNSADSAEYFFKKAIEYANLASLYKERAITENELGVLYMSQNKNTLAIELLLSSSEILSKSGDPFRLTQQNVSLGWMYFSIGDFEKSVKHYLQALEFNKKNEVVDFSSVIYNNLGRAYQELKEDLDSARYYYQKALNFALQSRDPSSVISPTINLGNIYYDQNNYHEALRYYRIALSNESIKERFRPYSASLINTGMMHYELGNYDSAEVYLNKGLDIAEKNSLLEFQQNAYFNLYKLDSARNRLLSAISYYKKQEAIGDSLKIEKLNERIHQLEYEQDLLQKEKENELLSAENEMSRRTIQNQWAIVALITVLLGMAVLGIILMQRSRSRQKELMALLEERNRVIEQTNRELEEANQTKDKFFAIIAHDLRNPFDALIGLLNELNENYEDFSDDFKKDIISNLHRSSQNTYKLLLNLLEWSRVQRGQIVSQPESIVIGDIIQEVTENLKSRLESKSQELRISPPDGLQVHADPRFVRAILTNLLNNAVKFTPPGGKIEINTGRDNGKLLLCVQDTGIGIPQNEIPRLFDLDSTFQRYGTEHEAGTGLGLVMCREYMQLMNEKIWVESKEGRGSSFCFTLPLSN